MALARGDLARARALAEEGRHLGARTGRPEARFVELMQSHAVLREEGRLDEAERLLADAPELAETFVPLRVAGAHIAALRGRADEARAFLDHHLETDFAALDDCLHWRYQLALLIEMAAAVEHRAAVEPLERLLDEVNSANLVSAILASAGAVARYRGLLAATAGRWPDAQRLLEQAIREDRTAGAQLQALRAELDLARLHLRRPGGRDEGLARLDQVARAALALGAAGIAAEAARQKPGAAPPPPAGASPPATFRREGEYWTITADGVSLRVRDTRGLHYLAQLLAEPGRELAALALAGGSAAVAEEPAESGLATEGDLGPLLDAQARAELRQRLTQLERENRGRRRRAGRARPPRGRGHRGRAASRGRPGRPRAPHRRPRRPRPPERHQGHQGRHRPHLRRARGPGPPPARPGPHRLLLPLRGRRATPAGVAGRA